MSIKWKEFHNTSDFAVILVFETKTKSDASFSKGGHFKSIMNT